jgi:hypothetical protein
LYRRQLSRRKRAANDAASGKQARRTHQETKGGPQKPLVPVSDDGSLRVSTVQQGGSGLGIEAQRSAIARFADAEGYELVREFVGVETGKGSDALDRRPQLTAALAEARKQRCSVVVAKLDRLSRDVLHLRRNVSTTLRQPGVEFKLGFLEFSSVD